jgi:hypothetical protein
MNAFSDALGRRVGKAQANTAVTAVGVGKENSTGED